MTTNYATREVMPLSAKQMLVPPGKRTRIAVTRNNGPLMLERFFLSAAGTSGGAADWIVNDIEIDGVSQLSMKDLPGALFGAPGVVRSSRSGSSALHFGGLDVIETDSEVAVTVTYVGQNPKGAAFFASILGDSPPQRPTVLPISTKEPIRGSRIQGSSYTKISARLDTALRIEKLEIDSGREGTDWTIHDISVDGRSQFCQSGTVPGDMFSTAAIDSFVAFEPGKLVEIWIEYIGLDPAGERFVARVLGTVVRDDYDQPPPDVHATIWTVGQDGDEEIIARCNWRAPHSRWRPPFEPRRQEERLMSTEDLTKKMQEEREKAVADHLAACERIRKKLELGPDALAMIDRALRAQPITMGAWSDVVSHPHPREARPERPSTRAPIRLESAKRIQRTDPRTGKPTPVIARPQSVAMRVEEIEILSKPEDWMIADIQVGYRSQFPQAGPPMPGRLFTPGGTCYHFVTETIQTAMDFTMLVHYVGEDPEGGVFEAAAMGTMARY